MATQLPPVILLIDDDPMFQYLVGRYVQSCGCRFFTAVNGDGALAIALQGPLALILVVITHPTHAHWSTLRQVKANSWGHSITIAICDDVVDQERALDEGADGCLIKPVMYDDFLSILAKAGVSLTA